MPPAGFELALPASERPPTHALDRAVTGTGDLRTENLIEAQPFKKFTTCCGTLKFVRPLLVFVFEADESSLQPLNRVSLTCILVLSLISTKFSKGLHPSIFFK